MKEIELKPCPFCGGKAGWRKNKLGWEQAGCVNLSCPIFPASPYASEASGRTKEGVAEMWNRRAV